MLVLLTSLVLHHKPCTDCLCSPCQIRSCGYTVEQGRLLSRLFPNLSPDRLLSCCLVSMGTLDHIMGETYQSRSGWCLSSSISYLSPALLYFFTSLPTTSSRSFPRNLGTLKPKLN